MSKFGKYLKEQYQDIKGMYTYDNDAAVAVRGSTVRPPQQYTQKSGIRTLRVGMDLLNVWQNHKAREEVTNITNFFGPPNILTSNKAIWWKIAGFDKVMVKDEAIIHKGKYLHVDYLYSTMRWVVPVTFYTPLAGITESFLFDGLKGEITHRCDSFIPNAIALGFAQDVIDGIIEADPEEFAMRMENHVFPTWFEIANDVWLEHELAKLDIKDEARTGGKYGRGYHQTLGRLPMDGEVDHNIKESESEQK